jgi:S1-C subfamily serine protease
MTSGPDEETPAGVPGSQNPDGTLGQPQPAPEGGHQPPADQPAPGEPGSGGPASGGPGSGEPAAGEPASGEPASGEPGSTWAYGPPPASSPGPAGWLGQGGTSAGDRHRGRHLGLLAGGVAALLVVGAAGGFIGDAIGSSGATAATGFTPGRVPARPGGGFSPGQGSGSGQSGRGSGQGSGFGPGSGFGGVPAGGSGQFPPGGSFPSGGSGTSSGPANASSIASRVDPGLVDVNITVDYGRARGAGTGMVLTSSGVVLTNNHVIDGATPISVSDVGNGKTYQAHVAGYDVSRDVAILKLSGAANLQTVSIARSGVSVGQQVVAIGNAGGTGGTPSYAGGAITATGQSITASDSLSGTSERLTGMIGTNAGIQAGDSGGPLVNSSGQVIGMDTAGSQTFQFSAQQATAGFAIPISMATHLASQILSAQPAAGVHVGSTAFLGIQIAQGSSGGTANGSGFGGGTSPAAGSGVPIAGVVSGSPAARAGLTAGDVITSVGGHPATSQPALQHIMVTDLTPGQSVTVSYTSSSGQQHSVAVVLASGPPA